ncbi:MAG: RIP metalloprotease RseP [Bacteroidales bacterium]|nr:RIP metalloprotease RseP [Bacteroidales bacterium]MCF8404941.1 RIP metalloprotease RseP [Bacteroidales bacterium]
MEVIIKILQFLLSLSILVIIHEFGHFLAAKIFKTRVEKFYLFFNPWFSIFKFQRGETEYGIGWLPLGGYVKISGMIDESMDKEQMKKPPQDFEFRAKPTWQRLIIMLGGVTMNIVLAVLIYIGMLFIWGEEYLPTESVKYGIVVDSLGAELGLQNGDKIISIDNEKVENFRKIPEKLILDEAKTIQVLRDNDQLELEVPSGFLGRLVKHRSPNFIDVRIPFIVDRFVKDSPARDAGMEKGDKIIGLNNTYTTYFDEFRNEIQQHKNEEVAVHILRGSDTLVLNVSVPEAGLIGVFPVGDLSAFFEIRERKYNIIEAVPAGIERTYFGIGSYLKQLKLIFSPEIKAYESVGGFITIGNIFPAEWHWQSFWTLTAFLSIMLAILNVLPIPALDGGHVMFLMYEIITRRKPSDKFMEYAQITGMVLLFALLIFANGNDIFRLFNK